MTANKRMERSCQVLSNNQIYEELGVEPVIHAGGTTTDYGGSRVSPRVFEAMSSASESFVDIVELNRAIGEHIARAAGAEAGMVTAGAASGLVLSLAACMTGTDLARVRQLPDTTGMRNELVIQKAHRGQFSRSYPLTGARFVEVGDTNGCPPEEMEAAISERTAAVAFLVGIGVSRAGLSMPEAAEIARGKGVPLILDAAAMLPPKRNLKRFVREGADLVAVGGKYIGAPQDAAMLFGRKELIEAALANASPNLGIGRPHKVSREDMVGLYTALKLYLEGDEERQMVEYRARLEPIVEAIAGVPGLSVSVEHDDFEFFVPTAVATLQTGWDGPSVSEIAAGMLEGTPRVYVKHDPGFRRLWINPTWLRDDEAEVVARRLLEELTPESPAPGGDGSALATVEGMRVYPGPADDEPGRA